jgi:ABC-type antimicrobial peptide transport system permease subunit
VRRPPSGDQPQNDAEHGSLGIYAVLAHHVALNKREIGVRMALGAEPGVVVGGVVRSGLMLAGVGILIGSGAAAVSMRGD